MSYHFELFPPGYQGFLISEGSKLYPVLSLECPHTVALYSHQYHWCWPLHQSKLQTESINIIMIDLIILVNCLNSRWQQKDPKLTKLVLTSTILIQSKWNVARYMYFKTTNLFFFVFLFFRFFFGRKMFKNTLIIL